MSREFKIPKINKKELVHWNQKIRPIVNDTYIRKLKTEELTRIAYTWLGEKEDYTERVDYSKLSVLDDVKMLHKWGYHAFFKPSVAEVISQIPKEYLKKVVAFQIIAGPVAMDSMFEKELNAGYHVSIVRLYQAKDETNEEAKQIKIYPDENSKVPVGMSEEQFEFLKENLIII